MATNVERDPAYALCSHGNDFAWECPHCYRDQKAREEILIAALRAYGKHHSPCGALRPSGDCAVCGKYIMGHDVYSGSIHDHGFVADGKNGECTCGFRKALKDAGVNV